MDSRLLSIARVFGSSTKPLVEKQGLFGFRNAAGQIVEVDPTTARVVSVEDLMKGGGR